MNLIDKADYGPMVADRYELLDQDPFWVPTTEEELEDLGEKSDRENVAKKVCTIAAHSLHIWLILLVSCFSIWKTCAKERYTNFLRSR